nr:hypothetical protein [Tanacetum cinerariifolium]
MFALSCSASNPEIVPQERVCDGAQLEFLSLHPDEPAWIKLLEDRDGGGDDPSRKDATIKGRSLETREETGIERSTNKGSNATEEMVNVLTSLDAASILTSRVQVSVPPTVKVAIVSIPPTGEIPTVSVPTGSGVVPSASPIFTTTTVATPYSRREGKEKMVELETPKKKKLQEQMDVQMARQLEEEMGRDVQRMNEQMSRDAEIARIHAEEKLQMLIDSLDRNNETVAKYLQDPQVVSAAKLPILNPNEFDFWKMRIEQYFLMTDYSLWEVILNGDSLGPTRVIEGLQVKQKQDGLFINQDKYVAEILRKFSLTDGKSASTPIDTENPLLKDPDAYSDSDYAGASLDRKSTIGGCQFIGCRLISWQCKKQIVVATSSTEAEYVAAYYMYY